MKILWDSISLLDVQFKPWFSCWFSIYMTECSHITFYSLDKIIQNWSGQRSKCRLWPAVSYRRTLSWLLLLENHVRHSSTTHKRAFVCFPVCISVCVCETEKVSERPKERRRQTERCGSSPPFGLNLTHIEWNYTFIPVWNAPQPQRCVCVCVNRHVSVYLTMCLLMYTGICVPPLSQSPDASDWTHW